MTAAAARENIAVSAVSRRVSELEARCGVALTERHERGVALTPAGRHLAEQLSGVFELFDFIAADLDATRGGRSGTIRLHTHMTATSAGLPEILAAFNRDHPSINLEIDEMTSAKVMHSVQTGMADLGLVSGTLPAANLMFHHWRDDQLVAVLANGHSLALREKVKLADLLDEDFIGMQRDSSLIQLYYNQAQSLGGSLRVRMYATSFESVRKMVSLGLGVAILPATASIPFIKTLGISVVELDESWARRPLMLCIRNMSQLSVAGRNLMSYFMDETRRLP